MEANFSRTMLTYILGLFNKKLEVPVQWVLNVLGDIITWRQSLAFQVHKRQHTTRSHVPAENSEEKPYCDGMAL